MRRRGPDIYPRPDTFSFALTHRRTNTHCGADTCSHSQPDAYSHALLVTYSPAGPVAYHLANTFTYLRPNTYPCTHRYGAAQANPHTSNRDGDLAPPVRVQPG